MTDLNQVRGNGDTAIANAKKSTNIDHHRLHLSINVNQNVNDVAKVAACDGLHIPINQTAERFSCDDGSNNGRLGTV
ncbi:FOG: TPR repeat [Acetobacter aceti NRIC 0242]|uniref:Uncharacterized protein n=2 Tax=Acetobacter aceti TaxID=435 RepID=A0A6S6PKE1_ACEAC|nr:hypothetical protein AAJCM20276_19100 [Acetobacter aceti]BCK74833.1 hypothetical protein EMQ_0439 [Acetobacter aceti NBRC 14818]GAN57206.1 hypothetical protein Abac_014_132 [Acetobacter aceti NBRC 14818]GBO80900.1 FOG: TPR repeat [Acetobacter aceti NRIC 0242]